MARESGDLGSGQRLAEEAHDKLKAQSDNAMQRGAAAAVGSGGSSGYSTGPVNDTARRNDQGTDSAMRGPAAAGSSDTPRLKNPPSNEVGGTNAAANQNQPPDKSIPSTREADGPGGAQANKAPDSNQTGRPEVGASSPGGGADTGDRPRLQLAFSGDATYAETTEDAPEDDSSSRVDILTDGTTRTIIETGGGAEHGGTTKVIEDDGQGNTKVTEEDGNGTTRTTIETDGGAEHGGSTTVTENDGHGNTRVHENDGHGTVKTMTTDASGTVTHTVEHKMPDGSTRFTTDVTRSDGTRTEVTGERDEQGREYSTTKDFTNGRLTSETVTSDYRQGTDDVHKTVTTSPSGETITDTKTVHDNGSTSREHVRTDPSGRITEHTTSETWQNDPQNPTRHYEATTKLNPDGSTTVTTKITEHDLANNDTHQKTTVETKDANGKQAGDSVTKETIHHWGQGGTSTEIVTSEHPDGSSDVEKSEFDEYHVLQSQTSESHPPPDAERPPDSNP